IAQADGRKVGTFQLAYPPLSRPRAGARVGKTILVEIGSNVAWGTFRKRIGIQQRDDARAALEETKHEVLHPGIRPHVVEGREPQLPVEAGLMRNIPRRRPSERAWLVGEDVFGPGPAIGGTLDDAVGS